MDEGIQSLNIHRRIAHHVGGDVFACSFTFCIESMNSGILDTRELTDDGFHFFQLYAETANLHHTVATTYEYQFTVITAQNDIARLENPAVCGIFCYFLGSQLWSMQISTAYLWSHDP